MDYRDIVQLPTLRLDGPWLMVSQGSGRTRDCKVWSLVHSMSCRGPDLFQHSPFWLAQPSANSMKRLKASSRAGVSRVLVLVLRGCFCTTHSTVPGAPTHHPPHVMTAAVACSISIQGTYMNLPFDLTIITLLTRLHSSCSIRSATRTRFCHQACEFHQ